MQAGRWVSFRVTIGLSIWVVPGPGPVILRLSIRKEAGFLVPIIPGPDPGIAPRDGTRRIRSGDDQERALGPARSFYAKRRFSMRVGLGSATLVWWRQYEQGPRRPAQVRP
jgi:hypothetical protein